jgi:SAM-dependent methyltransferase
MRKWYKYWVSPCSDKKDNYINVATSFEEHSNAMGGYLPDENYNDKIRFFKKWLFESHEDILLNYDNFLRKYLNKGDAVLSIASGRCVNELFILEDGFNITCSDMGIPQSNQATKSLFPNYQFYILNIIDNPAPRKYDAIICLSLICIFDNNSLERFFQNVYDSLVPGGYLILDSAGSPDNLLSHFLHEYILWFEATLRQLYKTVRYHRKHKVITEHFGYRRTNQDIIESAAKCGFELSKSEDYAFLFDFKRSGFLRRLINNSSHFERWFYALGKNIPYTRMFKFKKINETRPPDKGADQTE